MSRETAKLVVGTVSGLIVGGLVGYIVTQRALETKFETLLDEEVAKVKQYYKDKYEGVAEVEESEDPEEDEELKRLDLKNARDHVHKETQKQMSEHSRIVQESGYGSDSVYVTETVQKGDTVKAGIIIEGVNDSEDDDAWQKPVPPLAWGDPIDYTSPEVKAFIKNRDTERPYIITVDEFMEDNEGFEKQSITYFEGDESLCDDREQLIPDLDETVGIENLDKFGLYSRDKEIVFVRNERISTDFEVAFDERTYVEAVAGFKYRKVNRRKQEDD